MPRELVAAALASGGTGRHAQRGSSATPLAQSLAAMRLATAKYATNMNRAKADGYKIITPMIPDMGIHYMNPKVTGFDVTKPTQPRYFRSPSLRRLTAEQLLDSVRLATTQTFDPNARLWKDKSSTALTRALGRPTARDEISTRPVPRP